MRNHNNLKDFDFGARAASYDKGIEGRLSKRFYGLVLSRVQLPENARVLDAGCGTGALLRMIANRHPIIGFGIDMEPGMIEQARRQCPDMTIQRARCEQTPFEDASFDTMVTCMAYHHFSDKPGFAREAARILKPDGRLYIADVGFPTPIRQTVSGILRHRGIAGEFCTPGQITQTFEKHGFVPDGYAKDGLAQLIILKKAG